MGETEVARFECGGDVRRVFVGQAGSSVVVREELEGPLVEASYGEEHHSLRVALPADTLSALLSEVGFEGEGGLWGYLPGGSCGVLDLMDLCDRCGVSYAFASMGSGGDLQFRPAA